MHPEVQFVHAILPAPPMDCWFQILHTSYSRIKIIFSVNGRHVHSGSASNSNGEKDGGRRYLDTGHAVPEEGAGVLDMRDVVRVAEAAAAALVLGWVDASGRDGLGFLPPILPHRLPLPLPVSP